MSCTFNEVLCDGSDNVVFVTGIIDDATGQLSNLRYTLTNGTTYSGSVAALHKCGEVVSGGGDTEVGEGSLLPTDSSIYELFRLENHPTLPNGLYWWSENANQWVES
jgi:hypothetical protein